MLGLDLQSVVEAILLILGGGATLILVVLMVTAILDGSHGGPRQRSARQAKARPADLDQPAHASGEQDSAQEDRRDD